MYFLFVVCEDDMHFEAFPTAKALEKHLAHDYGEDEEQPIWTDDPKVLEGMVRGNVSRRSCIIKGEFVIPKAKQWSIE